MRLRYSNRLRSPDERIGTLSQTDLPPPAIPEVESERLLLDSLRAGDETAFESLIDRYHESMLRVATRYVRSREEAEEVVQDTWLALLAGLDRFEGRASLRTWIFRILVNRARTRAKRESRQLPFSSLRATALSVSGSEPFVDFDALLGESWPGSWSAQPWQPPDPSEEVVARELRATIASAVDTLAPRQQEVFTLRDLEGWSPAEVCDRLEISEGNQRVLLHRARLKIREAIGSLVREDPTPMMA